MPFTLIRVRGESMAPTLLNGDHVICWRTRSTRPGAIYHVAHPRFGSIIKRLDGTGRLSSDNDAGTDSDRLGRIEDCDVRGRAILAIKANGLKPLSARPRCSHPA